jgi:hypothetical protein
MRNYPRFPTAIPHPRAGCPRVTHPSAAPHPSRGRARLACIRHAASVDPEPGSNSPPKRHRSVVVDAEASWSTPKRRGRRRSVSDACASGPIAESSDAVASDAVASDAVASPQSETTANARSSPALACDGHALLWLTCCCWTSRSDPGTTPHSPHQSPPLAPSSAPDPAVRSPPHQKALIPPSVAPACQRAAPRFGARRAYLTLIRLSRVTSKESFGSSPAAPTRPLGCPRGSGRSGRSLQELDKNTA